MFIKVSEYSRETLQSQLVRQLRSSILIGNLEKGELLPSIRSLAKELKISVITVQKAYDVLESEQLIISRQGIGFIIANITDEFKSAFSKSRLEQKITPIMKEAIDEGLSITDINDIINNISKSLMRME